MLAAVELFRQLDDLERHWRVFEPQRTAFAETKARYERLAGAEDGIIVVAESGTRLVGSGSARSADRRPGRMSVP